MGDPKKLKKKYSSPLQPWNKLAIETEGKIKKDFGLKNKKEIYIATTFLKKYKDIAKKLIATKTAQAEVETKLVLGKLERLGLLPKGSDLNTILNLELKDIMERRLQSKVCRCGLAKSMNQARQFIVHRHIMVAGQEITSPAYLLSVDEESQLSFKPRSALSKVDHPERMTPAKPVKPEVERPKPVHGRRKERSSGSRGPRPTAQKGESA